MSGGLTPATGGGLLSRHGRMVMLQAGPVSRVLALSPESFSRPRELSVVSSLAPKDSRSSCVGKRDFETPEREGDPEEERERDHNMVHNLLRYHHLHRDK